MAQKNKAILATNNLIRILSITAIIIMPMIVYPENTTTNDRIYSKEQAKSGEELYKTNCLICHDKKYFRPSEVETLLGNPSKAKRILNWNPNETSFEQLVQKMVESDIRLTKKEISIRKAYD